MSVLLPGALGELPFLQTPSLIRDGRFATVTDKRSALDDL